MAKRGGTKRKIPMEKITKKLSIPPTFTKRRDGLFSKASQLCLLSGAQIAILVTPLSSESNVSFYSFGHSSVDDVVSAYLSGQGPLPVDLGLGNWWEDESLYRSENPEELRDAMDSMWTLLSDLKAREEMITHQGFVNGDDDQDLKKKNDVVALDKGTQEPPEQTLILQSTTFPNEICCIPDDDENYTEEQNQINEICGSFAVSDNNITLPQGNNNNAEEHWDYNEEMTDFEQLLDFETPFEIAFNDCGFENTTHLLDDLEDIDVEEAAASLLRNSDDHVSYLKDFEKMISAIFST